ncbi:MAG: ribonuclease P [Candidatus Micrarchaeia archaeon]
MKKDVQKKNRQNAKEAALASIEMLVNLAKKEAASDPALAQEYGRIAFRIAQKARCGVPKSFQVAICKKCFSVRHFGKNTKAVPDTKRGSVVYICACGAKQRFYYGDMPKKA